MWDALTGAATWLSDLAAEGTDLCALAHVKAAEEASELAETPTLEEWADVAICLVGVALGQHWTLPELAAAVRYKVAVNRDRVWERESNGTWRHRGEGHS